MNKPTDELLLLFRAPDFRPDYKTAVGFRSSLPKAAFLGLSATVTKQVLDDLLKYLHVDLKDILITAIPPDRPNIYISVAHKEDYNENIDFKDMVEKLASDKLSYPKSIIFVHSINQAALIYQTLLAQLGRNAYTDGNPSMDTRMVGLYHGHIGDQLREFLSNEFAKPTSVVRILVSTIAFGMGVNIPDIKSVMHYGKIKSLLWFWQEVGRCGRNGDRCSVTWIPSGCAIDDKELFNKLKQDKRCCIRKTILLAFALSGGNESDIVQAMDKREPCDRGCSNCECSLCLCCSHCRNKCMCMNHE